MLIEQAIQLAERGASRLEFLTAGFPKITYEKAQEEATAIRTLITELQAARRLPGVSRQGN